jgi:ribosomal protein S18 acetylase RimI-like enzyme
MELLGKRRREAPLVLESKDKELFTIRHATMSDLPRIYRTCLETGNGKGGDATALYHIDPDALGKRWCEPYVVLEPKLSFVLVDSKSNVCGYTLGALDTDSFNKRLEEQYLSQKRIQYPMPTEIKTPEDVVYADFHSTPSRPTAAKKYSSHIHIDLMPYAQNRGLGKKLLLHLFNALRCEGSTGVHLETFAANTRALRFYRKLGMHIIARVGAELFLGIMLRSPHQKRVATALTRTRWKQQASREALLKRWMDSWPTNSPQARLYGARRLKGRVIDPTSGQTHTLPLLVSASGAGYALVDDIRDTSCAGLTGMVYQAILVTPHANGVEWMADVLQRRAIKRLTLDSIRRARHTKEQTMAEVAIQARLSTHPSHPNICRLHECAFTQEDIFIVLDFCDGGDLFDYCCHTAAPTRVGKVREIFRSMMEGMQFVHAQGISHRDIKPENVMLGKVEVGY